MRVKLFPFVNTCQYAVTYLRVVSYWFSVGSELLNEWESRSSIYILDFKYTDQLLINFSSSNFRITESYFETIFSRYSMPIVNVLWTSSNVKSDANKKTP